MKQTISVVLATYNEEKNIGSCLAAVKEWANEIIVADGTSTDKTPLIAQEYGATIISTTNTPMFHTNKNIAIDAAKSDWILQLDADEVVSEALKYEIDQVINNNPEANGFWIPRSNYFLGHFMKKGGVYPDPTIRLYRRGKGRLAAKDIHEQADIDGTVGSLIQPLLHFDSPSFFRYVARWNRYTTLSAEDLLSGKVNLAKPAFIQYFLIKPIYTFFNIYVRHRGYVDGLPGFVWALFSALRFMAIYVKYYERQVKGEWDIDAREWQ